MSETKVKNKFSFRVKDFLLAYFLWIIGILLNIVPSFFKVLNEWLNTDVSQLDNFDFWKSFISDCGFMYVFCSVGFILLIELFFLKPTIPHQTTHNFIFSIILIYSIALLILYTVSFFNPYWNSHITKGLAANINFVSFLIIFLTGTIYFVLIHTKRTRQLIIKE